MHAKLWLMRFEPEQEGAADDVMRLMVLSRNLTADRSWDVSLVLDGEIAGRARPLNRPLAELVESLSGWATGPVSEQARARAARLAEQARRTDWELPAGFDGLQFHAIGVRSKPKGWMPEPSERLLVISPFVTAPALEALAETTAEPVALIARGEELDRLSPDAVGAFAGAYVLHGSAETEDGEDPTADAGRSALRGLHAKVFIAKRGWDTHIYLGSANATSQALLAGQNVELLAELSGKTSKVPGKGIDGVLSSDGLGALLVEYQRAAVQEIDSATEAAERALEQAIVLIASARIVLRFERAGEEHVPVLLVPEPLVLAAVASLRAWLVTTDSSTASEVLLPLQTQRAELAPCATASATGLVAFELSAQSVPLQKSFALNLHVEQMPAERDAQVIRTVVDNQDRFLAYLLALLGGLEQGGLEDLNPDGVGSGAPANRFAPGYGLLERLVRARSRDPRRLDELSAFVEAVASTAEGRAIVPQEFLEVWQAVTGEVAAGEVTP